MSENLAVRWMKRYKLFFLIGLLILGIQIFLAYKSLGIAELQSEQSSSDGLINKARYGSSNSNSNDDEETPVAAVAVQQKRSAAKLAPATISLTPDQLGFEPECVIGAKEAISALQRAKTKDCKKHIAQVACAIQAGQFYARQLPSDCPAANYTANAPLGCYRDEKEFRLLSGYFTNFKTTNTPERCIQLCLQSGYPYAGVQYGSECFCGSDVPVSSAKLPDSSCNMKCSGSTKEACGGYYTMNVYETGIAKFTAKIADTSVKSDVQRIQIAFLLTLNGRALRQVHRLIRALYSPNHVFFIHVDARQDYLFRKLLELEPDFQNIRLARKRFSTIWGGASLLTMLLQCMQDLLESSWHWDFVINLSESDFPVKTVEKLVEFLSANKGRNFVKSHGRETQRFIQKQGLDKTFVECDTHMWRIGDRQLPAGMQVDGGSDWVALSRPFVEYVTREQHSELLQGLLKIFRHTLLPAESFFHTVLRNSHFCGTYIDNNLHVTNWKRKLGCKCQYKHVVDWCGCSPNDFKPEDWQRLHGTEHKMLFFARKFEPIINQAIILQLEEWLFGPYTSEYVNLNAYWQSFYHIDDKYASADDLTRSIAESILRIAGRQLKNAIPLKTQLLEITNYLSNDQYKGFLLRYHSHFSNSNASTELETRIRPVQYQKLAKNSKFAKRLRNFEVSSDFDQKEQIARNFVKFLGPHTDLVLSFTFAGATPTHTVESSSYTYNLTILWIDPAGQLQDFNELHIEDAQTDAINFSKATLKHPLTPGIWTVKLIGRSAIFAQTKFLVAPLAYESDKPISMQRSQIVNLGSSLVNEFNAPKEWQQHLPPAEDVRVLRQLAQANAQRSETSLHSWIDELVGKFFQIRETCAVGAAIQVSTDAVEMLPLCKDTAWSSMAADPKSDINALLKRRR